jgi:hypothetical protein
VGHVEGTKVRGFDSARLRLGTVLRDLAGEIVATAPDIAVVFVRGDRAGAEAHASFFVTKSEQATRPFLFA